MFSVITNIYNKKTKGPTLMELFTATGNLFFFFTTKDVRCVHHRWHGTHRYDIQVIAPHADACVAVKNSIKLGPLVFLLEMFVIMENIMKRPVFKSTSVSLVSFCKYLFKLVKGTVL